RRDHEDPPSFPTRRSSDLQLEGSAAGGDADRELRAAPLDRERRHGNGEVRSSGAHVDAGLAHLDAPELEPIEEVGETLAAGWGRDRKSTRLNSSHRTISYA